MSKLTPTKFVREEFIKAICDLKGKSVEYLLNDGSGGVGELQYYNPNSGEYYLIDDGKIYIINHFNCLKLTIKI